MAPRIESIELTIGDRTLRGTRFPTAAGGRLPTPVLHHGFDGQLTAASPAIRA